MMMPVSTHHSRLFLTAITHQRPVDSNNIPEEIPVMKN
jgi:hypothetical protein